MNKKQYRRHNAIKRKVIARGMSVACRACGAKCQVPPGDYYKGSARCPACGGQVDRVHEPRAGSPLDLDSRRVVPRKPGCEVRGEGK